MWPQLLHFFLVQSSTHPDKVRISLLNSDQSLETDKFLELPAQQSLTMDFILFCHERTRCVGQEAWQSYAMLSSLYNHQPWNPQSYTELFFGPKVHWLAVRASLPIFEVSQYPNVESTQPQQQWAKPFLLSISLKPCNSSCSPVSWKALRNETWSNREGSEQ